MKAIWIVNDFGNIESPIGCFAKKIVDTIGDLNIDADISVESGSTVGFGTLKRCLSFRMTMAIIRAVRRMKKNMVDFVFVEYPFVEYNPIMVLAYFIMHMVIRANGGMLILSLHEYFRSKTLRRFVTRVLVRNSDVLFVTDEPTKNELQRFTPRCFVRNIFSPISVEWKDNEKKNFDRTFIYFGVINSSKAFDEMLIAFSAFNDDGDKHLFVYTSTDVSEKQIPKGVEVLYGCSDLEVEEALKKASFCILPINPEVNINNSTFIGAVQAGCTLIGHFSANTVFLPFVVNVSDYSVANFAEGMKKAYNMSTKTLDDNSKQAIRYGKRFSAKGTTVQILEALGYENDSL